MSNTFSIYERIVTKRRQKGYFQEVVESETAYGLTAKAAQKRLDEMNKGLRNLYSLRFFNLDTAKGKMALLMAIAENYGRSPTHKIEGLEGIGDGMIEWGVR